MKELLLFDKLQLKFDLLLVFFQLLRDATQFIESCSWSRWSRYDLGLLPQTVPLLVSYLRIGTIQVKLTLSTNMLM